MNKVELLEKVIKAISTFDFPKIKEEQEVKEIFKNEFLKVYERHDIIKNIEFLIPLEQKYANFFDINEVFRKVKYTLDMERNNTIISLFDEIIDEQIVSAKFKLIDDENGENAQSKKESVRKKN